MNKEQELITLIKICGDLLEKGYADAVKEILKTENKKYSPTSATRPPYSGDARNY